MFLGYFVWHQRMWLSGLTMRTRKEGTDSVNGLDTISALLGGCDV
jgi:hypothetical protein